MRKNLVSSIAPLQPISIVDVSTGEILALQVLEDSVNKLIDFVTREAQWLYFENGDFLEKEITEATRIGSANSFGRQRGLRSNAHLLPRDVKAKSRINELVLHKTVSEVSSYVLNPNPRKQKPSFSRKVNLGAVDKQMASLSLDGHILTLRFKVWDRDLLLDFDLPEYIRKRNIIKWSLPTIEYRHGEPYFIFSIQEQPKIRNTTQNKAGIDLGRKEPFTMAVVNKYGSRIANYTANGIVRSLNEKRYLLLEEKKFISRKALQYEKLGLDSSILRRESKRVARKALILSDEVARQTGADVAIKLSNHELNEVAVEDLRWVQGAKYGGRWNHSKKQAAIEHATRREGVSTKKVNPKNTSQECHHCGSRVVHNARTRVAKCSDCKEQFDRDFNAAMNIAKKLIRYPNRYSRIGDDRSSQEQVIEVTHNSVLRSITRNTT